MTNPAQNKATAIAFYELMFNECRPREAIALYEFSANPNGMF